MLKIVQTDWNTFDLAYMDPETDDPTGELVTLIASILFVDAEAPADREPDRYQRRGWYDDPAAGSGLWYVRRQALTDDARREALAMVRDALTNQSGGTITDLDVSETIPSPGEGNVSHLYMRISGKHNGREFLFEVPL